MSEKLSAPSGFTWKNALVWFLALYLVFTLYQYYDTKAYASIMTNVAIPLLFGFAALSVVVGKSLSSNNAKILVGFLVWVYLTELTRAEYSILNNMFLDVLAYSLLYFPLASMLPAKRRRAALRVILYPIITFMLLMSVFALVVVLQGRTLYSTNGVIMGLHPYIKNRLSMYAHPNFVSTLCAMLMMLSIYLALSAKKTIGRIYPILTFVVFGVIMALTDSRTGKIAVSVGVGLLGFVLAYHFTQKKPRAVSIVSGVVCAAVVAVLCYGTFGVYGWAVEKISASQGPRLIQRALAEDAGSGLDSALQLSQRSLLVDDGFNGRNHVWKAAFEVVAEDPIILLTGTGQANLMNLVNQHTPKYYDHLHNIFLQTLLTVGIPGLLLVVTFLVRMLLLSLRLFLDTSTHTTLAQRFLPATLVTCLIIGLAESHFFVTNQPAYNPLFFLVAGYVEVYSLRLRRKKAQSLPA